MRDIHVIPHTQETTEEGGGEEEEEEEKKIIQILWKSYKNWIRSNGL